MFPTLESLNLRPATKGDADLYFNWVNDHAVRNNAIDSLPIRYETHLRWFEARLLDKSADLFVLEFNGIPVGQVRFEICPEGLIIDYSIDSMVRGRGFGYYLLKLGIEALTVNKSQILLAYAKMDNMPSIQIFLKLGFMEKKSKIRGFRHFQFSFK